MKGDCTLQPVVHRVEDILGPVGLVCGNGLYPLELAKQIRESGRDVVSVSFFRETDSSIDSIVTQNYWLKPGNLSKIISKFKRHDVCFAAFAGGLRRPSLFNISFDLRMLAVIARSNGVHDDAVLKGIAREFEKDGIRIFSGTLFLKNWVTPAGILTDRGLTSQEMASVEVGWQAGKTLGSLDVGQSVLVSNSTVVALEAVEGSDEAIKRGGILGKKGSTILVKLSKPNQDLRFDMPSIGERTILMMRDFYVSAVVLEAGCTLIIEPEKVLRLANKCGIAIVAGKDLNEVRQLCSSRKESGFCGS